MIDDTLFRLIIILTALISFIAGLYAQISLKIFIILLIFLSLIAIIIFLIREKLGKRNYIKDVTPIQIFAVFMSIVTLSIIILIGASDFVFNYPSEELWGLLSTSLAILSLLLVFHDKSKGDTKIDQCISKLDELLNVK